MEEPRKAELKRLAAELTREADALYERADANMRRAEGLRWQAYMGAQLERQPPAGRSSLLFKLMQADLLLDVVEHLESVSDRLALACAHPVLRAYRMHRGEAWLGCGPRLHLTRHLASIKSTLQLALALDKWKDYTEVHLRFTGLPWDQARPLDMGSLMYQLSRIEDLSVLTIEANSAPQMMAMGMYPHQLNAVTGLRLAFTGDPVYSLNALTSLPRLEWAELEGIHFKPPVQQQLEPIHINTLLDELCAGGHLTSLKIQDSNLSESFFATSHSAASP